MKQNYFIVLLLMAGLSGCGDQKQQAKEEEKRVFQIESVDEQTGLQRMQVSRANQEIVCKGKKFQMSVERTPAEDLPHVKSDMGLFVDNRISVKITRADGSALFSKVFQKTDFASYLPESYLKRSVLEGMVFDDVSTADKNEITLAASVSYPMTDLYVPFKVVISQAGKMVIQKDEDMGEFTPIEEDSVDKE
ncbi:MAG: DUF4738 domain-containing protein [Bacteroidaceae bacterium]|nr:DUF4738 domain-containing protein [Bacteroidaceae bacterium]